MQLRFRPGVRLDTDFVEQLRHWATEVRKLQSNDALRLANRKVVYRTITADIVLTLSPAIVQQDIERLVMTRTYWTAMDTNEVSIEQLEIELTHLAERLLDAMEAAAAELNRWRDAERVLIPDTSVLMHILSDTIASTDWWGLADVRRDRRLTVVIPIVVLDELDRLKRTGQRSRARLVLREVSDLLGSYTTVQLGSFDVTILVPDLDHVPLPTADNEIIDQALSLRTRLPRLDATVTLLTADTGMAMRSRVADLPVIHLREPDETT